MPKLTASVTDGAVGVTVDSPVTVSAADGVLGAVTMSDEEGAAGAGRPAPSPTAYDITAPIENPPSTVRSGLTAMRSS